VSPATIVEGEEGQIEFRLLDLCVELRLRGDLDGYDVVTRLRQRRDDVVAGVTPRSVVVRTSVHDHTHSLLLHVDCLRTGFCTREDPTLSRDLRRAVTPD